MAKLTSIITLITALTIALLATASATITYTTITTTVVDQETGGSDECVQQIQPEVQLKRCMTYLSPYSKVKPHQLSACCEQLQNINKLCRCFAIQEMVRLEQPGRRLSTIQQVLREAQKLPSRCKLDMPQPCDIRAAAYF